METRLPAPACIRANLNYPVSLINRVMEYSKETDVNLRELLLNDMVRLAIMSETSVNRIEELTEELDEEWVDKKFLPPNKYNLP